jgi:Dullard-like phosphatase family protein
MDFIFNGLSKTPKTEKPTREILKTIVNSNLSLNPCFNSPSGQKIRESLHLQCKRRSVLTSPSSKLSENSKSPRIAIPSRFKSGASSSSLKYASSTISERRSEQFYREHLFFTFQATKFIRKINEVDLEIIKEKSVWIPKKPGFEGKKTVIFDLDETLVHTSEDFGGQSNRINICLPQGQVFAWVNIRPFARECLREAAKNFEVIVFTASDSPYADAVLDLLDPEKTLIHWRLYRESCIVVNNKFIKDLRILANRDLKDIILVDNSVYSFAYQLDNGIPIITWTEDPCDRELFNLIDYLQLLLETEDMRSLNRSIFQLHSFYDDYIRDYLKSGRLLF